MIMVNGEFEKCENVANVRNVKCGKCENVRMARCMLINFYEPSQRIRMTHQLRRTLVHLVLC
jgi:hypothetical protein